MIKLLIAFLFCLLVGSIIAYYCKFVFDFLSGKIKSKQDFNHRVNMFKFFFTKYESLEDESEDKKS